MLSRGSSSAARSVFAAYTGMRTYALGVPAWRILLRHILPNAAAPLIVQASIQMGVAILVAAGLSFLGLGVQPPTAEWGVMIAEGQNFITTAWWITTFPGLAIVFMAFGFSLLADGLAERFGLHKR